MLELIGADREEMRAQREFAVDTGQRPVLDFEELVDPGPASVRGHLDAAFRAGARYGPLIVTRSHNGADATGLGPVRRWIFRPTATVPLGRSAALFRQPTAGPGATASTCTVVLGP